MLIRSLIFAVLLLHTHSHLAKAVENNECSGHGHFDEQGVCICDIPWPESISSKGWVGEQCQIPVFLGSDNGSDIAAPCASSDFCSDLKEDEWVCFAVPPATTGEAPNWNFLAVLLNRTAGEGDADLYGYFRNASTSPSFQSATGFAFQDTSTSRNAPVIASVSRADYPGKHT